MVDLLKLPLEEELSARTLCDITAFVFTFPQSRYVAGPNVSEWDNGRVSTNSITSLTGRLTWGFKQSDVIWVPQTAGTVVSYDQTLAVGSIANVNIGSGSSRVISGAVTEGEAQALPIATGIKGVLVTGGGTTIQVTGNVANLNVTVTAAVFATATRREVSYVIPVGTTLTIKTIEYEAYETVDKTGQFNFQLLGTTVGNLIEKWGSTLNFKKQYGPQLEVLGSAIELTNADSPIKVALYNPSAGVQTNGTLDYTSVGNRVRFAG